MKPLRFSTLAFVLLTIHLGSPIASASVITVGVGAFGAGSTLTTFAGLANGVEVNGRQSMEFCFSTAWETGRW